MHTPIIQTPITVPRFPFIPPSFDPDIDWGSFAEALHFCAHMDTANPMIVCRWRGAPFFTMVNLDHPQTFHAMSLGALEFIPIQKEDWEHVDTNETHT
jgi:hypothetical protein